MRSVGFGQHLVRPVSCVLDSRGIYYDGSRPSDLEHLLQSTEFPPALVDRAASLRRAILIGRITKYNVGEGRWVRPPHASRVILVPGQVESDPAIHFGSPRIKTSMALLRAVREANPDACVVYKPHPEVVAGLRARGTDEDRACQWCDAVVAATAMDALLPLVDEVHVMTSLAGFEALLRDRKVTCYGQPFYSGWGLTDDIDPVTRRTRRLTLDELVAGALILYSTYISRTTGKFATPEQVLAELLAWRLKVEAQPTWRKALGWLLHLRARVMR
jgi:capsular polysaccharide export protein